MQYKRFEQDSGLHFSNSLVCRLHLLISGVLLTILRWRRESLSLKNRESISWRLTKIEPSMYQFVASSPGFYMCTYLKNSIYFKNRFFTRHAMDPKLVLARELCQIYFSEYCSMNILERVCDAREYREFMAISKKVAFGNSSFWTAWISEHFPEKCQILRFLKYQTLPKPNSIES